MQERVRVADDLEVATGPGRWAAGEAHYLYHEIFTHDDYLRDLPALRPDAVVVDAGANLGLFALRIARDCPDARLVAVEPVPSTCALLRVNTAALAPGSVRVVEAALGDRPGRTTLTAYRYLPANSTAHPREKPADWVAAMRETQPDAETADEMLRTDLVEAEVVTLSGILPPGDRIDLVKIDVEGAELEVLRGVDDRDWPRIDALVIEVHDVAGRLGEIENLLAQQGFDCTVRVPAMMSAELRHHIVTARRS
ncbi:FkbM family methyltransferase [Amycolatopsis sp. PS_44_ISF1]|uniref:FkbM family methyltransferase n=1 Tax=Amycolatopsis sp. PS_44_ISF1 TaxID=2974917 RepID=UPI0028DF9219|nr:FkbM family methyltransferase [Amycolatopsis sp. PS_44_ISF1]MDT8913018.1 FkbM family methyltransferase [Amycolatopsis sp. PS_44_ISF1]